jgi:hypothetical protein
MEVKSNGIEKEGEAPQEDADSTLLCGAQGSCSGSWCRAQDHHWFGLQRGVARSGGGGNSDKDYNEDENEEDDNDSDEE